MKRDVEVNITVISPKPMPLPTSGQEASTRVVKRLAAYGIRFVPNMTVTAVEADAVVCSETRLPCDLAMGIPPHLAVDVVRNSPLAADDGWVHVDRYTLETEFENVYAVGDCTIIPVGPNGRVPLAGLFAEKEGMVVAERIASRLKEETPTAVLDGKASCYIEVGDGMAAVIGGDFFAEPGPDIGMSEFSVEYFNEKHAFEQSRLTRWFS